MIASKLPVYNDTYQLLLTICKTVNNYSRLYKYSIGQSTIDTATELFEYIQLANMFRDNRKRYLNGFIVKFENLKVKIRIASDVGQIGISKRAEMKYMQCAWNLNCKFGAPNWNYRNTLRRVRAVTALQGDGYMTRHIIMMKE